MFEVKQVFTLVEEIISVFVRSNVLDISNLVTLDISTFTKLTSGSGIGKMMLPFTFIHV